MTVGLKVLALQDDSSEDMVLYVSPQRSFAIEGSTFTLNINIANVPSKYPGVWSYELKLYYNKTVLEGVNIELPEGHFLTPKIDPANIMIGICKFYQEDGHAYVSVSQMWPELGNTGSGTLVTATFKASTQGNSTIEIRDEYLCDATTSRAFWPDEYDIVNGFVQVVPPPDLNSDGEINIEDLALVGLAFGSYPSHPRWNPKADVNKDDTIDILDLVITVKSLEDCEAKKSNEDYLACVCLGIKI